MAGIGRSRPKKKIVIKCKCKLLTMYNILVIQKKNVQHFTIITTC